tara:strand:- start:15820 stop:16428 length:609 start_codon:yes stop_codon:yes gene_type:complete
MGRKSHVKPRKPITKKVNLWLEELLIQLQYKDLEKLTIDDLAELAEKSKSTIYQYFKSKEDVLLAVCQTRVDSLTEVILETLQQKPTTIQLYKRLLEILANGTAGISISFLQTIKKNYPKVWLVIEKFTDNFIEILKEQYKIGITEGVFNAISIDLMTHLDRIFIMEVVTNPKLFNDKEFTITNLISDYLNLRLVGLLKKAF